MASGNFAVSAPTISLLKGWRRIRGMGRTASATCGRGRPNTHDLDLDRAGIARGAHGYIIPDDQLRTSVPRVWALGECRARAGDRICGKPPVGRRIQNSSHRPSLLPIPCRVAREGPHLYGCSSSPPDNPPTKSRILSDRSRFSTCAKDATSAIWHRAAVRLVDQTFRS